MTPPAAHDMNGDVKHTEYGVKTVHKIVEQENSAAANPISDKHEHVLKTFRLLIADLCQQFNGGHPGGAIGMAAIGVALWKYVMVYAPLQPEFFNRDRFVLSNGHTCLFQYTFLHLTGYREMDLEQLKGYHSSREDNLCPGHPEKEHDGIEVTTGPLGQGIANAVGMAIASKNLAATYNKPGFDVVSNHIWCMVGDACLQEGVALEAISFAGHLKLNNLTVIYDNNQVTCDGSVDLTNTEDINAKMRACGWTVIDIEDGNYDVESIVSALKLSKRSIDRPTFINVRTVIGLGSARAGDALAHGVALGAGDVADMKRAYKFDPDEYFAVSHEVRDFFADIPPRGEKWVEEWDALFSRYSSTHPELAAELSRRLKGELPSDWESHIPQTFPEETTATRKASGLTFNPIAAKVNSFMVGTADLAPSVSMDWKGKVDFQNPALKTQCGINGSYSGRFIHYGIREHAMAAMANGMAAYHPNMIIPVTSSFFMFYLYASPAVRMGALQSLQVIHAATHDSIGMGEDGPTHQPLELAALFRAMPNLLYIRPGDSEETAGAWLVAIKTKNAPSMISTSRHSLPQFAPKTKRAEVAKGAYVLEEVDGGEKADLTLIGVGAELRLAMESAENLRSKFGLKVRVVSFPCQRLFLKQPIEYRRKVLQRHAGVPAVVIEPYVAVSWERYADAAICMSMDRFGQSLPSKKMYEFFGFDVETISGKLQKYLHGLEKGDLIRGEFLEL